MPKTPNYELYDWDIKDSKRITLEGLGQSMVKIDEVMKEKEDKIAVLNDSTVKEINGIKPVGGKVTIPVPQIDTTNLATKADITPKADRTYVDQQISNIGSATPKGVYATVTALQTSFPTGATGVYVVSADGKWYYWSGTAWTAGGVYQSTAVPEKSLTPKMFSFPVIKGTYSKNKNKFDKTTATEGIYFSYVDGVSQMSSGWWVSDVIYLKPNFNYAKQFCAIAFFTPDGTFISGLAASVTTFTTPSNIGYAKLTSVSSDLEIAQLEEGVIPTTYESGEPKSSVSSIAGLEEKVIDQLDRHVFKDTNFKYPPVYASLASTNLFDKVKVIKGRYINSSGVSDVADGWFAGEEFEVKPNTVYSKSGGALFIYTANRVMISRKAPSEITLTTEANAKYARMTSILADLEIAQVNEGSVLLPYQTGAPSISKDQIADFYSNKNLVIVGKSGGQFDKIQKAIDGITKEESLLNPLTILLMPGTYYESINNYEKSVSIIGVNRDTCIIRDDSGDYYKAPVNMSANMTLENVTCIATHDSSPTPAPLLPSYGIHHDFGGEGKSFIRNCKVISYQNSAIGIGLQDNQQLEIDNCEFYSTSAGAMLMHNQQWDGGTNQKMVVKNSVLRSEGGTVLMIADSNNLKAGGGTDRDTTVTFYNNMLWSSVNGKTNVLNLTSPMGGGFAGYISLTADSFGNNVSQLNL